MSDPSFIGTGRVSAAVRIVVARAKGKRVARSKFVLTIQRGSEVVAVPTRTNLAAKILQLFYKIFPDDL
jgi:hypothetical protein